MPSRPTLRETPTQKTSSAARSPASKPRPLAVNEPEWRRARKAEAFILWGAVLLSGVVTVVVFILWHLARRGRLIREGLAPPRRIASLEVPDAGSRSDEPGIP